MSLVVGLLLGGIVTLAVGRPELGSFGNAEQSTASAIASDQPLQKAAPAKDKAKPRPKAKHKARPAKARKRRRAAHSAPIVAAATPDSGDRAEKRAERKPRAARPAPVAAPRHRAVRVVARRPTTSPKRRSTKTPSATPQPAPAPAPAPAAATPPPPPASTPAPAATPARPGNGHGHGNCKGCDDDPGPPGP